MLHVAGKLGELWPPRRSHSCMKIITLLQEVISASGPRVRTKGQGAIAARDIRTWHTTSNPSAANCAWIDGLRFLGSRGNLCPMTSLGFGSSADVIVPPSALCQTRYRSVVPS